MKLVEDILGLYPVPVHIVMLSELCSWAVFRKVIPYSSFRTGRVQLGQRWRYCENPLE